jgi:hypothetical protein
MRHLRRRGLFIKQDWEGEKMELSSELIEIEPGKKVSVWANCLHKAGAACTWVLNALRFRK